MHPLKHYLAVATNSWRLILGHMFRQLQAAARWRSCALHCAGGHACLCVGPHPHPRPGAKLVQSHPHLPRQQRSTINVARFTSTPNMREAVMATVVVGGRGGAAASAVGQGRRGWHYKVGGFQTRYAARTTTRQTRMLLGAVGLQRRGGRALRLGRAELGMKVGRGARLTSSCRVCRCCCAAQRTKSGPTCVSC